MIKIKNISLKYDKKNVVKNASCLLKSNQITTIIGPNGCGKSTLLKAMSKNMKIAKGDIWINEKNIRAYKPKELARLLALLPQNPKMPLDITVSELVGYGRYPFVKFLGRFNEEDHKIVAWALEKTDMTYLRNRMVSSLSGGERQRAWIAMALSQQPKILLLDEPTTYLDIAHQFEILELIKEIQKNTGMTIVMVLHDINHAARYSDHIIVMNEGEFVIDGTPEEIVTKEVMKKVFNLKVDFFDQSAYPHFIPIESYR